MVCVAHILIFSSDLEENNNNNSSSSSNKSKFKKKILVEQKLILQLIIGLVLEQSQRVSVPILVPCSAPTGDDKSQSNGFI